MTSVFYIIKFIFTLIFTYLLLKKSEKSAMLQKTFVLFGSLFFSGFLVAVGWVIVEGFFLNE
jgi:hypothetical protein